MSPAITPQESVREAHALMDAIDTAAREQDWPGVVEACRAALAHPCAAHAFYVPDIWTGLAEAYVIQERYDDAIDALQAAVASGHRPWPHPDVDIARLHLLAGREAEATALFESHSSRFPEDLWVFYAAGAGCADLGEHQAALGWFTGGITLAMGIGDLEGVTRSLQEGREGALKALGQDRDDVSEAADAFLAAWSPPAPGTWEPPAWPEDESAPPAPLERCDHCGYEAPRLTPDGETGGRRPARLPVGPSGAMGVAWFTADEWPRAVARWPNLLDEMPADHHAYVRELQSRVLQIAEATGGRLIMVPISLGGLLAYCQSDTRLDPGSGRARADYAATLLQEGHGRPWPPERNEPCWCGSGRKYKLCCATVEVPGP